MGIATHQKPLLGMQRIEFIFQVSGSFVRGRLLFHNIFLLLCGPLSSSCFHPLAERLPDGFLLVWLGTCTQSTRARRHKNPRAFPAFTLAHPLSVVLPSVVKLFFLDLSLVPPSPDSFPDAFAYNANCFRAISSELFLKNWCSINHFRFAELCSVLGWPFDNIRIAHAIQSWKIDILFWLQPLVRASR